MKEKSLFGINYETWRETCEMYFQVDEFTKSMFLQTFPFAKLSEEDMNTISGKDFFDKYIQTGSFVFFPTVMQQSENYIHKADGSFRDSSLLSPVLFLILQAVGGVVFKHYSFESRFDVETYYAGNYELKRPNYRKEYKDFCSAIKLYKQESTYFIKTDLSNFFSSINLDVLIKQIDKGCNTRKTVLSQTQLTLYKELLAYCGNGHFPLVENSIASSYLATVIYLDEIDSKLNNYIKKHIKAIDSFKMVRYVDDMYILFSTSESEGEIRNAYNQIRNEYSSILKEYGLALNSKKTCFKHISRIETELKKASLNEDYVEGDYTIDDLYKDSLVNFLRELSLELSNNYIDVDKYNSIINNNFSNIDEVFLPEEVFNYFTYRKKEIDDLDNVTSIILRILENNITFISLDPRRLTTLLLKTKNEKVIKALLNQLFRRVREEDWNSYDTTIAITYLINRGFEHRDLIEVIKEIDIKLYEYYKNNCENSFINVFDNEMGDAYARIVPEDWKSRFLFFMYTVERSKNNNLAMFAFFKSFFDRISADLEFITIGKDDKPNYGAYFRENNLKNLYKKIRHSQKIIKKAHKIRNSNPLIHASSELIDGDSKTKKILETTSDLKGLVDRFIIENDILNN